MIALQSLRAQLAPLCDASKLSVYADAITIHPALRWDSEASMTLGEVRYTAVVEIQEWAHDAAVLLGHLIAWLHVADPNRHDVLDPPTIDVLPSDEHDSAAVDIVINVEMLQDITVVAAEAGIEIEGVTWDLGSAEVPLITAVQVRGD